MNDAGEPLRMPSRTPEDVWFRSAGHRFPLKSRPAVLLKQIPDRFTQHILCRAMLLQCHRADLVMDGRIYPHRDLRIPPRPPRNHRRAGYRRRRGPGFSFLRLLSVLTNVSGAMFINPCSPARTISLLEALKPAVKQRAWSLASSW